MGQVQGHGDGKPAGWAQIGRGQIGQGQIGPAGGGHGGGRARRHPPTPGPCRLATPAA